MDLRNYYRKIREMEATMPEKFPVVTSLATEDGGREGVISEVSRYQAAKLMVEGKVRLATEQERMNRLESIAATQQAVAEWEQLHGLRTGISYRPDSSLLPVEKKPASKDKKQ